MRILHVTTALDVGGAEMMILKLASHARFTNSVLALLNWGPMGELFQEQRIGVTALGLPKPGAVIGMPREVHRVFRAFRPDIIQGWLYHGNLLASLLGPIYGIPVLWNIRQLVHAPEIEKRHTRATLRMLTWLHRVPRRIIYNSEIARAQHEAIGLPHDKGVVIPNGFDTEKFRPDPAARAAVRQELGISESAILVGQIGRDHVMKAHDVFLGAAKIVADKSRQTYFVIAGRGVDQNQRLFNLRAQLGLVDKVRLLGHRADVERLTAALDIACNSSFTEAFSNAIGEALACGLPAVVTEVGDSVRIIGAAGRHVPPNNATALAAAILEIAGSDRERARLGCEARKRAVALYSIGPICDSYEILYRHVVPE
ncbi:MAG: glycosyltransferase [Stellaceae bacterium]